MLDYESVFAEYQALLHSKSFEQWSLFSNKVQKLHNRSHTNETRKMLRQYYKTFIKIFINTMNNNTTFIRLCFKYARMFKDSTELVRYYEDKQLGVDNVEYVIQLAQLILYEKNDKKQATQVICDSKFFKMPEHQEKLTQLIDKINTVQSYYLMDEREYLSTPQRDQQLYKQQFLSQDRHPTNFLSQEEVRLHDYYSRVYEQQKRGFPVHGKVKIYKLMSFNEHIIQQMITFLQFNRPIKVYYRYHENDDYQIIQVNQIPSLDRACICYVEYIDSIPSEQSINDVLRFKTQYAVNLVQLQKQLGQGGFGKVFKAVLQQNTTQFSVAVKFFIRKKDIVDQQGDVPMLSASYLRELYALSVLNYRGLSNDQGYLSNLNAELPFTKVYCGLVGKSGNGAIILEYLSGQNLYDMVQRQYKMTSAELLSYLAQMVRAVALLHSLDIIHNDIKVDNWIVTEGAGTLKLCDFGKAVDLRLFCTEDQVMRIDYKQLNAVSPTPSQVDGFLFDADISGIAASLFSMVFKCIMQEDDIVVTQGPRVQLSPKNLALLRSEFRDHQRINELFELCMNYKHNGMPYMQEKEAAHQFCEQLAAKIQEGIEATTQ